MLLEPINNQWTTLHTPTLTIRVGKIIQICHGEVTIMISSIIKEIGIKITKVMNNKDRFYHLYQAWKIWWSNSSNTKVRLMRIKKGLMLKHHKQSQTFKPLSIKSLQVYLKRKVSFLLSHNNIREAYVKFRSKEWRIQGIDYTYKWKRIWRA